jgi:pimeloyl-ACP methyl ester carboxylesterase
MSRPLAAQPLTVPRWPRRVAYGAAGLAVLLPSSTAGAGWYFASQLLTPSRVQEYPLIVRAVDGNRVTLTRTEDTERPIPLGLVWPDGHARLGEIVRMDKATVVRRLDTVTRGSIRPGLRAYAGSFVFDGNPFTARALEFTDVVVPGELGPLPAWQVGPGSGGAWAIAVHGRGADRGEALRVLPTLCASGMTTLVLSYRNDVDAPASRDRIYHLGDTEWHDVAAAITYAGDRGATAIVLYGWSMGGAIVLNTLRRAPEAHLVVGAVLDSPVVDWTATLHMHARQRNMPRPLTWTALRLVEQRINVRLGELDQRRHNNDLRVPVLTFVDADDNFVAPEPTRQWAAARPDLVTLIETRGGGHARSWNVDPTRYESAVNAFVKRVAGEPTRYRI